jgi:hypothetical protein
MKASPAPGRRDGNVLRLARVPRAMAAAELAASFARDHRWVRLRMIGWVLLALWPTAQLAAELFPLDLMARPVRIAAAGLALVGTGLVAVGFERIVAEAHRRAGEAA